MRSSLLLSAWVLALALPPNAATAQNPEPQKGTPEPTLYLVGSRAGDPVVPPVGSRPMLPLGPRTELTTQDARPWAYAPTYEAWFVDDGIDFSPIVRGRFDHKPSLRFRLESVGRAAGQQPVGRAERSTRGDTVAYTRPGFVEEYEVREDHIEQSFRFESLPAGTGDLVVRGRIATEFTVVTEDADGLRFELGDPDTGGVRVGHVTGIDATGRTARGGVRYQDGILELSLPAEFVDTATLPLVLDPPIGSTLTLTGFPTLDERDPDVAYDKDTNRYAVVYERIISGQRRIMIRRFDTAGTLIGTTITVRTPPVSVNAFNPRVANVAMRDAFIVCWSESFDIRARAMRSSDGSLSNEVTVAGSSDVEITPDIGGEATNADDDCVVVWDNESADKIQARQVQLSSSLSLGAVSIPVGIVDIVADSVNVGEPEIAKSGGADGVYLIVWRRDTTATDSDIRGAIYNRNLGSIDTFVPIESSTADEDSPEVDGDGTKWSVVYERAEMIPDNGDDDVACRFVYLDGSTGRVSGRVIVEGDPNDDEQNPAVAWCGESCLISAADQQIIDGSIYDMWVRSVDPFTCMNCEGRNSLELSTTRDSDFTRIGSQFHGAADPNDDEAMIIWESLDPLAPDGEIFGRIYRADDGVIADLGGGCGVGGSAVATCARIGNSDFQHRVRGAAASVNAWLVLATDRLDYDCGGCTLIPNPFNGFVFATMTDSNGNASVSTAIPGGSALSGYEFIDQWLVAGAGCTGIGAGFSNAIRVQIQ